jgi:hypothetical protein
MIRHTVPYTALTAGLFRGLIEDTSDLECRNGIAHLMGLREKKYYD